MTTIAFAGKGGVGKTSLATLAARFLAARDPPVLTIDGDPNSNLGEKMGMVAPPDLAAILDELKDSPSGIPKHEFMEARAASAIAEGVGLDLLTMGRPQGAGCYCFANNVLRDVLRSLTSRYRHVLVDNEAGMEHLSRRVVDDVDALLIVSDPTAAGLKAAERISAMSSEIGLRVARTVLVVNSVRDEDRDGVRSRVKALGFNDYIMVPYDTELHRHNMEGSPLRTDGPAAEAIERLMERLILSRL